MAILSSTITFIYSSILTLKSISKSTITTPVHTPLLHKNNDNINNNNESTINVNEPPILLYTKPPSSTTSSCSTPDLSLSIQESKSILSLSLPMVLTGLLLYSRSMISMLFLGHLGGLHLAGGALAISFANITGYSVLSGLAMGMEPLCSQSVGAQRYSLLGLTLQKTVLLLLSTSLPIAALWLNMKNILLLFGQNPEISTMAQSYILFTLPDLVLNSFLHPMRIYLRTQSITMPLTYAAALAISFHLPANFFLVVYFQLGIKGVALASIWTNLNLVIFLALYISFSGVYQKTSSGIALKSETFFSGWTSILNFAIPSCISVCLEWWWYEIMILLCGLLLNPQATVASMGVLIQTTSLIYIFPSSLSFGVSTRVGNELGANQPERAKMAAKIGLIISFVFGLLALTFAVFIRNVWAKMFTLDEEIVKLTSLVLPILGLCELGNCPQTTGCGVLRGSARPGIGANINLGSFYGVGMPVAVGLAFWGGFDFKGLWLGLMSAQGTCVMVMLAVISWTDWELQAEKAQKLTGRGNVDGNIDNDDGILKLDGNDESSLVIIIKIDESTALS